MVVVKMHGVGGMISHHVTKTRTCALLHMEAVVVRVRPVMIDVVMYLLLDVGIVPCTKSTVGFRQAVEAEMVDEVGMDIASEALRVDVAALPALKGMVIACPLQDQRILSTTTQSARVTSKVRLFVVCSVQSPC